MQAPKGQIYGYVYKFENIVTKQVYIGQTKKPTGRKNQHYYSLRNDKNDNPHLQKSFNEYGEDNFKFIILSEAKNQEDLDKQEIHFINQYNSLDRNYGYNLRDGGIHGKMPTESREKISRNNAAKRPEVRKKMSESTKGKRNPMYGKNHSEKSRTQMRLKHTGKKMSKKCQKNMSKSHRGNGLFGFTGTCFNKFNNPEKKCWGSYIRYNYKKKFLGLFHDPLSGEIVYSLVAEEVGK